MELHVDQITAASISGWGQEYGSAVPLELSVNGSIAGRTTGNLYRRDLHEGGLGDGHLGFTFLLRRPGLRADDVVEFRKATSREFVYRLIFREPASSETDAAYRLLDQIPPFTEPLWRPMLVDGEAGQLRLAGALFVPKVGSGAFAPGLLDETNREMPATIAPATAAAAARFWWLDGEVFDAAFAGRPGERRVVLRPFRRGPTVAVASDLNFAVLPSLADLAGFRFPGADRARRVAGGCDTLTPFAGGGLMAALQLLALTEREPIPAAGARVLDWGCGPGRVLQFLKAERPGWEFHGFDVDAASIDWCREALADLATFELVPRQPPVEHPDGCFDFIFGLSVVDHLTETTRDAWLGELARLLKQAGTCVLTYQSAFHLLQQGITPGTAPLCAELAKRGISDSLPDATLGAEFDGYYRATFTTTENIAGAVGAWFDIVGVYPRTVMDQDAIVLRRR